MEWLFWLSNNIHSALRMLFYPETYRDRPRTETVQELRNTQEKSPTKLFTLIGQEISHTESQLRNSYPNILRCIYWFVCGGLHLLIGQYNGLV